MKSNNNRPVKNDSRWADAEKIKEAPKKTNNLAVTAIAETPTKASYFSTFINSNCRFGIEVQTELESRVSDGWIGGRGLFRKRRIFLFVAMQADKVEGGRDTFRGWCWKTNGCLSNSRFCLSCPFCARRNARLFVCIPYVTIPASLFFLYI